MAKEELHFVLIPLLMAQGHMIPMIDIVRMLAERGVTITILTTPVNANRFKSVIARAIKSKLRIKMIELYLPSKEVGLPKGCENFDMLSSAEFATKFRAATSGLQEPVEEVLQEIEPAPCCLVSETSFPWTNDVARKFNILRLVFHGPGCFYLLCLHTLASSNIMDEINSNSEPFTVPDIPDQVKFTKAMAGVLPLPGMGEFRKKSQGEDKEAYGIMVNTFHEMEGEYLKELVYKNLGIFFR